MMMNLTTLTLWTRYYPQPLVPPLLASFNHQSYLTAMGLGFLAWRKKMEVKSFDGFGIVSINASARRHHNLPQSDILRFRDDIDKMDSLNRTTSIKFFLQHLRKILYINCVIIQFSYCDNNNSWSELGLPVGLGGESAELSVNDSTHSAKGCWITVVAKFNRIKTSISSSCEFVCPLLSYHEYSLLYSIYEKFSYDSIKIVIINMMWWRQWKWQWLLMNNEDEDKQNAVMTIKRSNITKFQHTPRSDAVSD